VPALGEPLPACGIADTLTYTARPGADMSGSDEQRQMCAVGARSKANPGARDASAPI
jgi:hypothetical protein